MYAFSYNAYTNWAAHLVVFVSVPLTYGWIVHLVCEKRNVKSECWRSFLYSLVETPYCLPIVSQSRTWFKLLLSREHHAQTVFLSTQINSIMKIYNNNNSGYAWEGGFIRYFVLFYNKTPIYLKFWNTYFGPSLFRWEYSCVGNEFPYSSTLTYSSVVILTFVIASALPAWQMHHQWWKIQLHELILYLYSSWGEACPSFFFVCKVTPRICGLFRISV